MTTQSTIDKLIEMRLTSMSDAFLTQLQDARMRDISFEDRFGMLVDIEYSNRKSNSLKRLIRNAGFDQPDAYIGDINYTSERKLNRSLIERLQPVSTSQSIETCSSQVPQGVERPTWHALSVWRPVSVDTLRNTFDFRACSWS